MKSVATIGGGGLCSFLENFAGKDRAVPKLALYRLWLGSSVDTMKCLAHAQGDGTWGQLHDAYFLAEGDKAELGAVLSKSVAKYGKPVFGGQGKELTSISDKAMPATVIEAIKSVHLAKKVTDKS